MLFRQTLAIVLAVHFTADAAAAIRVVAASGQSAPGSTGTFLHLYHSSDGPSAPVINGLGRTAFAATLTGSGVTALDDTGMWAEGGGALALVGREGFAAPTGPAGALYRRLANPVLNDSGALAYAGTMREGVAGVTVDDNGGVWSSGGGSLGLIAREGSQAAGAPAGVEFATMIDPTMNASGQSAFRATLSGAGVTATNDDGVWSQKQGLLGLVARAGNAAPGTPAGVNYLSFTAELPAINDAGNVAFRALLTGTGVSGTNDSGLWVERNGSLALVAREGAPAAGVEVGVNYGVFSPPSLNAAGQLAFVATLPGSVNSTNVAIFAESNNVPAVAVRKGAGAPGGPAGAVFANFTSPLFNSANDLAFQATLSGVAITAANNDGIWTKQNGTLAPIALEGAAAPGTSAGVLFSAFNEVAMNANGQVAFLGTLAGTGITTANDSGLWATTISGELRLVAREGSTLADDLAGTVNGLYFAGGSNNEDGQRSGFNDRGEIAFLATNADGTSRIVVSDLVAPQLPADFNNDAFVDGGDLLIWQRNLGMATGATKANGDADGDHDVDAADLALWKGGFGVAVAGSSSVAAVPEPSSAAVAVILVAGLLGRGRRPIRKKLAPVS